MSTRACIAFETDPGGDWRGRYHHSDGYPSGLGRTLFDLARRWDFDRMRRTLFEEHTGWSSINGANWDAPIGFNSKRLCALCGISLFDHRTVETTPCKHEWSRGPACYCHGDRSEEGWIVEPKDMDDSDMEWCYIVRGRRMDVHRIGYQRGLSPLLISVDLDQPEPDWDAIERA